MKSNKLIILLILIPFFSIAQEHEPIQNIRELIDEDYSQINEEFDWLINHKISLFEFLNNKEIYSLYINDQQHQNLLEYYVINGELIDLLELQSIDGFTEIEYVSLSKIINTRNARELKVKSKIVFKTSFIQKSIINENYLGNKAGLQQRLNYQIDKNIKIGFARENDVGEPYYNLNETEAFDHHSSFMNYKRKYFEIILGHYEIFYGHGLLIGQGFNQNLLSDISNISSIGSTYRGIANNNEYNRLRGTAILFSGKSWRINIALSSIKRDDGNTGGYHRTINEISKKRKINDRILTVEIGKSTNKKQLSVLLSFNKNKLSISTLQQFYFSNNKIFSSEIAIKESQLAYVLGFMLLLNKNHSISISKTHISSNYNSIYMNNKILGISKNDQGGYRIAYTQGINNNHTLEILALLKKKDKITNKREFGQYNNRLEFELKRNKKTGNSYRIIYTYIEKSNELIENHRIKVKYSLMLDSKINVRYQLLASKISKNIAWSQSIQIYYKSKNIAIANTVCNYKASSINLIYFHENSINGNVMSSLNTYGLLNDLSVLISKNKCIKILGSIQNKYEYNSQKNEQRIMIRIEIRC